MSKCDAIDLLFKLCPVERPERFIVVSTRGPRGRETRTPASPYRCRLARVRPDEGAGSPAPQAPVLEPASPLFHSPRLLRFSRVYQKLHVTLSCKINGSFCKRRNEERLLVDIELVAMTAIRAQFEKKWLPMSGSG
jgi:hypothetical protein